MCSISITVTEGTGTLWEGRYKAALIDSEAYLLICMRYIELNPGRAGNMANHPSQYPWSSYRNNALGLEDMLVTPHREYKRRGLRPQQGGPLTGNYSGHGYRIRRWMKYAKQRTRPGP